MYYIDAQDLLDDIDEFIHNARHFLNRGYTISTICRNENDITINFKKAGVKEEFVSFSVYED